MCGLILGTSKHSTRITDLFQIIISKVFYDHIPWIIEHRFLYPHSVSILRKTISNCPEKVQGCSQGTECLGRWILTPEGSATMCPLLRGHLQFPTLVHCSLLPLPEQSVSCCFLQHLSVLSFLTAAGFSFSYCS